MWGVVFLFSVYTVVGKIVLHNHEESFSFRLVNIQTYIQFSLYVDTLRQQEYAIQSNSLFPAL